MICSKRASSVRLLPKSAGTILTSVRRLTCTRLRPYSFNLEADAVHGWSGSHVERFATVISPIAVRWRLWEPNRSKMLTRGRKDPYSFGTGAVSVAFAVHL